MITQLEAYKLKYGLYPSYLNTSSIKVENGVDYYSDSTRRFYHLAYSEGIMDINTISYDSRTKKWEKRFNY